MRGADAAQAHGDGGGAADGIAAAPAIRNPKLADLLARFDAAISDDLNTAVALTLLDEALGHEEGADRRKRALIEAMDAVLGFDLLGISRFDLRVRPKDAALDNEAIEALLATRKTARTALGLRHLGRDPRRARRQAGVEVMDGDPLRWDWKLLLA